MTNFLKALRTSIIRFAFMTLLKNKNILFYYCYKLGVYLYKEGKVLSF
jgi:hypothetical protein